MMSKYFLKRLGLAITSIIIIATIVYFLLSMTKTSPIDQASFGDDKEAYLKELAAVGLDKPVWQRFLIYISDIFTGRGFGIIYEKDRRSVAITDLFFGPLVYSLWVTIPTFILSSLIGITLGFVAGYKKGTWVDALINVFVITFIGIPSFILGALALAGGGFLGLPTAFIRPEDGGYKQMILSLILPILVVTLSSIAAYTYLTRNEVVTVLKSNQVTTARAKGLNEWEVFKKHILRNISIPLVSIILPSLLVLLSSTIIIETFFQIPGTSSVIIAAVTKSEYNIVMFNVLFFVFLSLIFNIILDILYIILDPRIKYNSISEFKTIKHLSAHKKRKKTIIEEVKNV